MLIEHGRIIKLEDRIANLEAQNTRLQDALTAEVGEGHKWDEMYDKVIEERDGYEALAERRRAILEAAYNLINYREHAFYQPEMPLPLYLYRLHGWLDWALPALHATPAEAGERDSEVR